MASHAQPVAVAPVMEALPVAQGHVVTVEAHVVPSPAAMVREDISEEALEVLKHAADDREQVDVDTMGLYDRLCFVWRLSTSS